MTKTFSLILGAVALTLAAPLASPAFGQPRGDEPIAVPRTIKQGIDFVYVDPEMSTVTVKKQKPRNWLQRTFGGSRDARASAPNPLFMDIARGLDEYQASWGRLPQNRIAEGPTLKRGATGRRVEQLRTRLGLLPRGGYDQQVMDIVAEYQRVHALGTPDGIAGKVTIASLNRGAIHYAQRIAINMERAYRLPQTNTFARYVVVDSGAAEAYLFDRDRRVDAMRVVVGSAKTKTPMMAVLMRSAKANPYWNVPPEMIASFTAKKVLEQGVSYLDDFHYEVLSSWTPGSPQVDPRRINWKQVAAGRSDIHVRQLPGPWNSMGEMKFEMPNDYGIYLHDTPVKDVFAKDDRWISNGCVRLSDYRRFAAWVFPRPPQPTAQREQRIDLPKPVPVYMTYLTVVAGPGGIAFRPDPYGMDVLAAPQMFGSTGRVVAAG